MKFKSISISNFRNFENISFSLGNKNVIFGMNDTGKTNFLFAIRMLLDSKTRRNGFINTDYFKNDTSNTIDISLTIDITDRENSADSRNLISHMKGQRGNDDIDSVLINLVAKYDKTQEFGNPVLKWGSSLDDLQDIPQYGERSVLDNIFAIVYIDPLINLDYVLKDSKRYIFDEKNKEESDLKIEENINSDIEDLNNKISQLSTVKRIESVLTKGYKQYRDEDLEIQLRSEASITGYWNNIKPYIKWNEDDNYYPTSGDGRKKLLSYAIKNIVTEKRYEDKIVIHLIEEPENSLHRSVQLALSKQLFEEKIYDYLFMTTHSSEVLYYMDNLELIKITNDGKSKSASYFYEVPSNYLSNKKKLNKNLTNSMFYNEVLLIEGGSEYCLFESVFFKICPNYELDGKYMVQVDGISFKPYIDFYNNLGITWFIKTDNDIKQKIGSNNEYQLMGINRGLSLIGDEKLPDLLFEEDVTIEKIQSYIKETYHNEFEKLSSQHVYVSNRDLENDLEEIITKPRMEDLTGKENPVLWLQSHKLYNMVEFSSNLTEEDCRTIYNGFEVLKEFINDEQ